MKSFLTSLLLLSASAIAAEKPNIVLIMADDLGLGDISHHVRTQMNKEPIFETPAIDALARESLWFTDGHSSTALCSPTRYCVMSGNNNYRSNAPWGVWNSFRESAFVKGDATLGTVVRDAGYATGFVGKWHLGGDFKALNGKGYFRGSDDGDNTGKVDVNKFADSGPKSCGFDYDFTLPCGIQGPLYLAYENEQWYPLTKNSKIVYFNKHNATVPKDVSDKGPGMGDSGWNASEMGQILSKKAVDFIETSTKSDENKPFFLYYCSPTVHLPHCPPDEFDGKKIKGQTPSHHLDMALDLDQQVNRIVTALKSTGVYDNTVIVLTSDNGGLLDKKGQRAGHHSSGLWAGSKNTPLEGGTRVPFFAVWKGHITPGVTDEPAINQDMLATFAALVGSTYPDDQAQDSNNLLPLLTGQGDFKQRDYLVQQAGSKKEIMYRKGDMKLIIQSNLKMDKFEPIALYDLGDNPYEKPAKNLVKNPEFKKTVAKMRKDYLNILNSRQRTTPLPTP